MGLKEAEEEYLRGSAIMDPDNKASCYDANIAADLFESAAKDFALADRSEKSKESMEKSLSVRKQVNDNVRAGKCSLSIGPKPNPPTRDNTPAAKRDPELRRRLVEALRDAELRRLQSRRDACDFLKAHPEIVPQGVDVKLECAPQ